MTSNIRNGDFVRYTGDLMDEFEILDWVVDRQTLEIPGETNLNISDENKGQIRYSSGKIESVNGAMLKSLLEEESDLVVFMFREDNRSDGWATLNRNIKEHILFRHCLKHRFSRNSSAFNGRPMQYLMINSFKCWN